MSRTNGRSRMGGPLVLLAASLAACPDKSDSDPSCTAPQLTFGPSVALFDGQSLSGWDGDPAVWRVESGEIVGNPGDRRIGQNTFLVYSGRTFSDFALTVDVLLVADAGNSGIQLRSRLLDPLRWSVAGYQADVSKDGWGLLYDEGLDRGALAYPAAGCQEAARSNDWNRYEIVARGCSIELSVNGVHCTEFGEGDASRPRGGSLALQYHAPGGFEVRFRNVRLAEPL